MLLSLLYIPEQLGIRSFVVPIEYYRIILFSMVIPVKNKHEKLERMRIDEENEKWYHKHILGSLQAARLFICAFLTPGAVFCGSRFLLTLSEVRIVLYPLNCIFLWVMI